MATTEAAILARVRTRLDTDGFHEAVGLDFAKEPSGTLEKAYVLTWMGDAPIGGMGYTEEGRGRLQVALARAIDNDYETAVQALTADWREILLALVDDGHVQGGDYAIEDAGRTTSLEAPTGASYLVLRLSVPVNFEAVLA